MKTKLFYLGSAGFVAAFMLFSSCQKESGMGNDEQYLSVLDVSTDGISSVNSLNLKSVLVETPALSESELASLQKMKEEEKLARDVYSVLYQKWGSVIFSRISTAENNHLNAIIRLLQYYGSVDTLTGEAGIFDDSEVQALYVSLVSKGSESVEEAYKTGAMIEEMDIKDLSDALAATSNANITMVFENLERGSRNHLRSFYNQLTSMGVVYTPVYLTQAEYDLIVTSAMEKGKQYKKQGKGKGIGKGDGSCDGNGKGKRNGKH